MLVHHLLLGFWHRGIQKIIDHWHEPLRTGHQCHVIGVGQYSVAALVARYPSPSPLALLHHFVQIRRWTYLD
jgi:hypothetical protein